MGQIQTTVSLVLIGLFAIALLGFAVNFASDNNAPVSISNDPELTSLYTQTTQNVSSFSTGAESTYSSIIETTISPESGSAQSVAPFAITPWGVIGIVSNIIYVGYFKIFGTGTGFGIFITTLIGMITFIMGLYLYKSLRGNPD